MSASPAALAAAGGAVVLTVNVQADAGARTVQAVIVRPDYERDTVSLSWVSGSATSGIWQAQYTIPRNFTSLPQTYTVIFSAQDISGVAAQGPPVMVAVAPPVASDPGLLLTSVPPFGGYAALQGQAINVSPSNYKVAIQIFVEGLGYYSKPYCSPLFTTLNDSDGTWSASITTGGVDPTATQIVAYLVPADFNSSCRLSGDGLPPDLEAAAVARAVANRTDPNLRVIQFAGRNWWVKSNSVALGPGPTYFSNLTNNVFLDAQNRLHLKLTQVNGTWYGAEVVSQDNTGNGIYQFFLDSPVYGIDPNIVLGLFTWDYNPAYSHREIDSEQSKFGNAGDSNNSQFVVQPYTAPNNQVRFFVPPTVASSAYSFQWFPEAISFQAASGQSANPTDPALVIKQVTNTQTLPPPGTNTNIRMNVWLFNGQPPTNNQEAEFIIRDMRYAPLSVTAASVSPPSGTGEQSTFQMEYTDSAGAGDLSGAWVWFAAPNSPSQMSGACVAYYAPVANQVYLMSDSGAGWLGPAALGSAGSLANGQCSLGLQSASAAVSGNQLTLTLPVTFTGSFTGTHNISLKADGAAVSSGWQELGTWTVSAPVLSITLVPYGSLTAGENNAAYILTVSNQSAAGTGGPVTVTESLPAGLTLVSMAGDGWKCSGNSCSRSDALAPGNGYPAITVTVNVASNASSPLVNSATVSGGGASQATATNSTVINPTLPALTVALTQNGSFTQGQLNAQYTVTVSNQAGAGTTSAEVDVNDFLPVGLTFVSMTGAGWTCTGAACNRSDALAGGVSYPGITVTVNVASNAASPQANLVAVYGGSTPPPAACLVAGCPGVAVVNTIVAPKGPLSISPASLDFGMNNLGVQTGSQTVTATNNSSSAAHVAFVALTGAFYSDYSVSHNCATFQPGSSCQINVSFTPQGVGPRPATLLLIDDAINSPQVVALTGFGTGSCSTVSGCVYNVLNQRVTANQGAFFVYRDNDSPFNHGYPSGLFGTIDLSKVTLDSACVDDPASVTGCSSDPARLDAVHATAFRLAFPPLLPSDYVGVNFQDPQSYSAANPSGTGYNVTPATYLQLDARSPGGATVQFGVGGCVSQTYTLSPLWQTINIPLATLLPPSGAQQVACPPDLTNVQILFTIATSGQMTAAGGTVLIDNVQFLPVPSRQASQPSLPLGNQTFGAPLQADVTPDQANRDLAPIYEASATVLALLNRGQAGDIADAFEIVNALDYALHHENHGDPLPAAPDGSVALHSAYPGGDLPLQNGQAGANAAQAGDVKLAGFTGGTALCPPTGFCLVLDGATGGNNSWAMLAFLAAYANSGNQTYLTDAETIGNWIEGVLKDNHDFLGYLVGISDSGPGRTGNPPIGLIPGKSTENNGDIFVAFSMVAAIENAQGNSTAAMMWTNRANWAGDFVMRMYDPTRGRFFAGTVAASSMSAPGNCQDIPVDPGAGERINTCDFVDSNTFTLLPMALSARYASAIDWTVPLTYVVNHFAQTVTAADLSWSGFDLVPIPTSNVNGISWEFTGQVVEAMRYADQYLNAPFQPLVTMYMAQIQMALASAPFGDGLGLPASTLQNGDALPPLYECLSTPFQCIPERVGLAASNWAIYADTGFNPLGFGALVPSTWNKTFQAQAENSTSAAQTVVITNVGMTPAIVGRVTITGPNASEFVQKANCGTLPTGNSCSIPVTFTPSGPDARQATLRVASNAIGGSLQVALSGTGLPPDDFLVTVTPSPTPIVAGNTETLTVTTLVTRGGSQSVTLSATCGGLSVSGGPIGINAGDPAVTFQVPTAPSTPPVTYTCTVTGTGTFATRTGQASFQVVSPITVSPSSLTFAALAPGASSSVQPVTVSNRGPVSLTILITLGDPFPDDFTQTNNCGAPLASGATCTINVKFTPQGVGPRLADLLVVDTAGDILQTVRLIGSGAAVCPVFATCAYQLMNGRAAADQSSFFVYLDQDSGLNKGFPAGAFGSPAALIDGIVINAGCVDSATSPTACSTSTTSLDGSRGTVLSIKLPVVTAQNGFDGLNIQEPQNFVAAQLVGTPYNLTGANAVQFDVRSPDGAVVQFGVGGCNTPQPYSLTQTWSTIRLNLSTDLTCTPDLTSVNLLFAVATSRFAAQSGGTVLLDNIQFLPAPARQSTDPRAYSLPVGTATFGAVPALQLPVSPDQVDRGVAPIRDAALAMIGLLRSRQQAYISSGVRMANALAYALYHDNHGDPIPTKPGSINGCYNGASAPQCGLHSAYISGDIAFLNAQPSPELGQAGDSRLAGFSSGTSLCGPSAFCLVLDGASGGNNAMAMLAFLEAYGQSGAQQYLDDARVVGNWIVANLADNSGSDYHGYFVGYNDGGSPKSLIVGKSTADNALIYAAFNRLAQVVSGLKLTSEASQWTAAANAAGDFVQAMLVPATGRFAAGTVPFQGKESVNTADSLDSDTLAVLALAGSSRYGSLNLKQVLQSAMTNFAVSVTAGGTTYSGFQLAAPATGSLSGIWWEGTAQMIEAMRAVDPVSFANPIALYLAQLRLAQTQAPFGDGLGLPVVTIQGGDSLPPYQQCLSTPEGCLPERVGLAATAWGAFASLGIDALQSPSACDIDLNGVLNVSDIQLIINEALGVSPAVNDLNQDGVVNVADVQVVVNAVLGLGCSSK